MDMNEKLVLVENSSATDERFIFPGDPNTLKVRGGDFDPERPDKKPTDPVALSRAILHVLGKNEYVRILSVGPKALNIAMKAFRLAASEAESRTNGAVLVCRQSEYEAIIANKKTKGLCTRIFGIPIKNAL
jgi:stage V sporulation protein SpoVS